MSQGRGDKKSGGRPSGERLQKVLARTGLASRRAVEEMIREGRITVNGQLAVLGQRVDLTTDAVKVDGRRVAASSGQRRYLLLHKPPGCVSTRADPEGRATVIDLLPVRLRKGIFPVGRLDFETEGLLILTDDGEFAQKVAHPRYGCRKVYEVKVKGRPDRRSIERLKEGISLDGRRVSALSVVPRGGPSGPRDSVSNSWWTVTLGEGRTRQIREMFFRIGHPVSRLRRVAIGPIADPHLPRGGWRELTEKEVERLRDPSSSSKARGAKTRRAPSRGSTPPARPPRKPGRRPSGGRGPGGRGPGAGSRRNPKRGRQRG